MSGVEFLSSDKRLCRGFSWARKQAMEYVRDQAAAGPCYEAALPGRDAFCMRDAAHQSGGAHCLGLMKHNRNMMRLFASNIDPGRDFCTYWEITSEGLPAPVDYTNDSDFWYNLPANFDVTYACSRLYDLTGDPGYLLDREMSDFHRISTDEYVLRWDRDGDGIVDRVKSDGRRGIASYDEGRTNGYKTAADALSLQYAAFMAAARMYALKGEPDRSGDLRAKALKLQRIFNDEWWDEDLRRFHEFRAADGGFITAASFDNALAPLRCGIITDRRRMDGQIDYLLSLESGMNVEVRSYVPLVLWKYGRDRDALRVWLKMTDESYPRREYPEISYAAVEGLVFGYMGIECGAEGTFATRPALRENEWAQITDLPLWDGTVSLRHEGGKCSRLVNETGKTIRWSACFGKDTVFRIVPPGQSAEAGS